MALRIRARVTGVDRVVRKFRRMGQVADRAMGAALFREGEALMTMSKPITPIEFGPLRNSGFVNPPKGTGRGPVVEVGFGGAAAPYAVFVHERLDLRHRAPTQAKYLEQPFRARQAGMASRVGRDAWRRLQREIR